MTVPVSIPFFEGRILCGQAEPAVLSAGGSQVVKCDVDGVQLLTFGRLRLTEARLRDCANSRGIGPALAEGWRQFGDDLIEHVSGDYLIAIWQPDKRSGFVAVDRFSTYSLFWGERDGQLAFATRPARVCDLLGRPAEIDPRAIHAYVYFHVIPAPLAIYRGVRRLDVARLLSVRSGGCEERTHWIPKFEERSAFQFETERDAFMGALRQGVRETIAGVPREELGCFLSGGTDSSTLAGLVTEAYGAPARTFSIVFEDSQHDESYYSRIAARHFGTEHTEHVLTLDEVERALDVIAASYEQPFGNSSAVPTYACAKLAHESGVRRMLGGDGGDELYGGNERYGKQWLFSLYGVAPRALRTGLIEPLLLGPMKDVSLWPIRKARAYVEQARGPFPDRLGAKYNLVNRMGAANVLTAAVLADGAGFDPIQVERDVWSRCTAPSQINRLLAYDFKFTLGDNDLPKVTRMCQAAGTEVAFPMLADAVIDHSLKLPPDQKLRRMQLRYFFRKALRGFLPDAIIDKPKHGFAMPFGDWFLTQPRLAARAQDALSALAARGLIRTEFLGELHRTVRDGYAGDRALGLWQGGEMIWLLMILELWLRQSPAGAGA